MTRSASSAPKSPTAKSLMAMSQRPQRRRPVLRAWRRAQKRIVATPAQLVSHRIGASAADEEDPEGLRHGSVQRDNSKGSRRRRASRALRRRYGVLIHYSQMRRLSPETGRPAGVGGLHELDGRTHRDAESPATGTTTLTSAVSLRR